MAAPAPCPFLRESTCLCSFPRTRWESAPVKACAKQKRVATISPFQIGPIEPSSSSLRKSSPFGEPQMSITSPSRFLPCSTRRLFHRNRRRRPSCFSHPAPHLGSDETTGSRPGNGARSLARPPFFFQKTPIVVRPARKRLPISARDAGCAFRSSCGSTRAGR